MQDHGLQGYHHCTKSSSSSSSSSAAAHAQAIVNGATNSTTNEAEVVVPGIVVNGSNAAAESIPPQLLIWSAADESAVRRMLQKYSKYYTSHIIGDRHKLSQLAYTLAARRSAMAWRTFAVVNEEEEEEEYTPAPAAATAAVAAAEQHEGLFEMLAATKPVRVSSDSDKTGLAFVFTGQGAQYAEMGLELRRYAIFEQSLQKSDEIFKSLGYEWTLIGMPYALLDDITAPPPQERKACRSNLSVCVCADAIQDQEKINNPEFSQPLCTALQIALVDLLRSFNIFPVAVVGHSSGEIAAAYTVGALSHESSCRVAYFRGKLAGQLRATTKTPGAMLSANLSEEDALVYLEKLGLGLGLGLGLTTSQETATAVHVSCLNSPGNVTLSGPAESIDILKADLDRQGMFAQKLNTGIAYHSPAMMAIAEEYAASIGPLPKPEPKPKSSTAESSPSPDSDSDDDDVIFVSSVTGQLLLEREKLATAEYWVDNLVSPVRFSKALANMMALVNTKTTTGEKSRAAAITDLIEIGPHAALRRPVKEALPTAAHYHPWIQRSLSPLQTTLHLVGGLFCRGYAVSVAAANGHELGSRHPFLVDCPPYPFDHSKKYWNESRISKAWRLRDEAPGFLLGRRAPDWNALEPRWRNWLSVETIPWLNDHAVS